MKVAPVETEDLASPHPSTDREVQRGIEANLPGVGKERGELLTGPPPLRHDAVRPPARPGGVGDDVVDHQTPPARVIQRASHEDMDLEHGLG